MTTAAAENTAGQPAEKAKTEKRRALGRGLESLLRGPRVVQPVQMSEQVSESVGQQQVPVDSAPSSGASLRAGSYFVPNDKAPGEAFSGTIQAIADEELDEAARADGVRPSGEGITILAQAEPRMPGNLVVNLAIEDIDSNPFQTRFMINDEALEELAESIKANGVLQPIVVRPAREEGRYVLILGERRLHASKLAEKTTIPAMVRRVSEQQAAELTIIENLQREDLSPLEQAEAFRVLSSEFKLTQAQIGERVGLSRESVANYMRLLKLPGQVTLLLRDKKISFALAKELLKLGSDDHIIRAAFAAVDKAMTVEQLEQYVQHLNGLDALRGQEKKKGAARWVDPNVKAAQFELEQLLGVRVRIRDRKGKGKIVIEYSTVDDYERVVGMLRGKR